MISRHLTGCGLRTWRTSIKQHHTLSFLFLKLLRRNPQNDPLNYYGFNGKLAPKIRKPWKILELTSLAPALFSRVLLPLLFGYIVVCDRYLLDTLVTLSFFLKEPALVSGRLAWLLTKMIPKNSFLVYFEADTKTILERKRDEPLDESLIEYYKKAYRYLAERFCLNVTVIDNTVCSVSDVQAKLLLMLNPVVEVKR